MMDEYKPTEEQWDENGKEEITGMREQMDQ
jgi:hypothetical protein